MKSSELTKLVDEGVVLQAEIDIREKRLKEIEKKLKAYAEANPALHIRLKDEDREGTRLLCPGSAVVVPVVFTSDLIQQSLDPKASDFETISSLAGAHFPQFYTRVVKWTACHTQKSKFDGKAFRAAARELLPDPEAFIAACVRKNKDGIPMSQTRVEWSEAEPTA